MRGLLVIFPLLITHYMHSMQYPDGSYKSFYWNAVHHDAKTLTGLLFINGLVSTRLKYPDLDDYVAGLYKDNIDKYCIGCDLKGCITDLQIMIAKYTFEQRCNEYHALYALLRRKLNYNAENAQHYLKFLITSQKKHDQLFHLTPPIQKNPVVQAKYAARKRAIQE